MFSGLDHCHHISSSLAFTLSSSSHVITITSVINIIVIADTGKLRIFQTASHHKEQLGEDNYNNPSNGDGDNPDDDFDDPDDDGDVLNVNLSHFSRWKVSAKIQQLLNTLKKPKRRPLPEFYEDDDKVISSRHIYRRAKSAFLRLPLFSLSLSPGA